MPETIAMHSRVKVAAPGPLRGFTGSVTALYANNTADVVLDDGRAGNEGGKLNPIPAQNFALTSLALA